ncbi:NAD(P)/FAD-dependent oxidoreductase [Hahella aquimaris]|uniref:NAD(P)/FAD-dependent oxidoreductase n=1 Tax=Hahella sp. HNIBRBA332 TaxID=3015983 RepID=UPI00273B1706|nr:NAD(P)/FAD-dependent oxidoreductase [Hahella sp. HNIBRBA332]WLQ16231.1 NAD(P)/FAD-dependent oxidoreductase [Hahella sp. HNIBRBA332]
MATTTASAQDRRRWDVIILGAGPAGSALARLLRPSHDVLVIERRATGETGPRIGESLPGAASVLLRKLGLWECFLESAHLQRGSALSVWDAEFPVWREALFDPCGPGWLLDRRGFDRMLYEGALESGACILEDRRQYEIDRNSDAWSIQLPQDNLIHTAPVLVDATGRSGTITRRLGLPRQADDDLLCAFTFLPCLPDDQEATLRTCADKNGWWYSARIPHGKRVLAYHFDAHDPLRHQWREPRAFLTFARRHAILREIIANSEPEPLRYHPAGAAILDLTASKTQALAQQGFLAIGDALISFDPISSQGLFHCLASAVSAANAIKEGFPFQAGAWEAYRGEMLRVAERYLKYLAQTYAGPERFAPFSFWAKRRTDRGDLSGSANTSMATAE